MKKEIIEEIINRQEQSLKGIVDNIETLDLTSDMDEDDTNDPDDYSQQDEATQKKEYMNQEKIMLENNISKLKVSLDSENSDVSPGALLEAGNYYFLVGPSFKSFKFKDKEVMPLSTETKVYTDNKGKKSGDVLDLNNASYTIESIQ